MARIHLRPSLLKIRRKSVRWIVIHHTVEIYDDPAVRVDKSEYQTRAIFNQVMEKAQGDVNYHYIVEKVKEEYVAIATRPFVYLCDWPDIPNDINERALHVALLGSYDIKIPERRMYEVLAFRLLNPFMKMYGITPNRIKLHSEVTNNKDEVTCPGEFIDKNVIIAMTRRYVIK
jgi:hypothetical protein